MPNYGFKGVEVPANVDLDTFIESQPTTVEGLVKTVEQDIDDMWESFIAHLVDPTYPWPTRSDEEDCPF